MKPCKQCGQPIERRTYPCGKRENPGVHRARIYCSNACQRHERLQAAIDAAELRVRRLKQRQTIARRFGISP